MNTQIRATSDFSSSINLFNLNDHPSYYFFLNLVILNGILNVVIQLIITI